MHARSLRKVLIAQIGARLHYAVPRAFAEMGMLERLVTDISAESAPLRWMRSLLPSKILPSRLQRLLDRQVIGVPHGRISSFPIFALSGLRNPRTHEAHTDWYAKRNARFGHLVTKRGFGNADIVYAFNGAALEIFRAARAEGLAAILDQTAAPFRWNSQMLAEEVLRWPGWEHRPADLDATGRLMEREEAEWKLADQIVCGSQFVAQTVGACGGPTNKCVVIPYPFVVTQAFRQAARTWDRNKNHKRLRLLFVGTLELRKGVQYLAEAVRRLPPNSVEARLVGLPRFSDAVMGELKRDFDVLGARPRSEIVEHYRWADVFVLPTLSEGSANVCYEAMAAGLPLITTTNAGSTVEDGKQGLIVPVRDIAALVGAIERLAGDGTLRKRLGHAAASCAEAWTLQDYARRFKKMVRLEKSPRSMETALKVRSD